MDEWPDIDPGGQLQTAGVENIGEFFTRLTGCPAMSTAVVRWHFGGVWQRDSVGQEKFLQMHSTKG